jgi:tripartite-type tricarboxylate transporter receptor subunit TctC
MRHLTAHAQETKMSLLYRAFAATALTLMAGLPSAQAWPDKPVRMIAVFPPGGSVDQVARVLAQQLSKQLGQSVVVENVGGASGSIGTAAVARAAPDGYTFGVVFDTHGTNPSLIPNISFDTMKGLEHVTLIGTSPMALVASGKSKYMKFADVNADARSIKGITIGSIGTGSLGHLAMIQAGKQDSWSWTHIPYRGGGPLMTDAVGGQVPVAIGTVFLVNPHVKGGKLRALAVTSAKPSPQMPGVGTVADQGVPGFSALSWWGVIAPAGTPAPIIKRMHDELSKALKNPAVAEKLTAQGMDILGGTPEEMDKFLKGEIARWAKVVKDNKIKAGD